MKFNNTGSPKFHLMQILKDNKVEEHYAYCSLDNYLFISRPDISEEEVEHMVVNDLAKSISLSFLFPLYKNRMIRQENTMHGLVFSTRLHVFSTDQLLDLMEQAYVAGMKHNRDLNCQNGLNPLPSNLPVKLKDEK